MCLHISHFSKINKSLLSLLLAILKRMRTLLKQTNELNSLTTASSKKSPVKSVISMASFTLVPTIGVCPTIISYHNLVLVISIQYFIAGVEEYVEALTFLTFLREGRLLTLEEIQKKLCFRVTPSSSDAPVSRSFGFYAVGNFIHLFAGFA